MDYNVDNIEAKPEINPTANTDIVLHKDGEFQRAKIFGFNGKIKPAYVESIINETIINNNYSVDPGQIVPSEALYNDTPETLAGDVLKRVDKFTGEDVNYRETTVWRDGTAMTDAKADGVLYIKRGAKYYKRAFTEMVNVKWFGAKGNFNPDTLLGSDDTDAFIAAIAAVGRNQFIYIPDGIYKITRQLNLKSSTSILGDSLRSIIWVDLIDKTKSGIQLNTEPAKTYKGILKNFSIFGINTGAAESAINAAGVIGYSEIDVNIRGGFNYMFYTATTEAWGGLKNGIENSKITIKSFQLTGIWDHTYPIGECVNGFYSKAYINASKLFFEFSIVQNIGVQIIGNYSGAGSNTEVQAVIQLARGTAMIIKDVRGGLKIPNIYCEGNFNNQDLIIDGCQDISVVNAYGSISVINSNYVTLGHVRNLKIDSLSYNVTCDTLGGASTAFTIPDTNDNFVVNSLPALSSGGYLKSHTTKSLTDFRNYVINGDFKRLNTTVNGPVPWGVKTSNGVITDRVVETNEGNTLKISIRPGFNGVYSHNVDIPLKGRLNSIINVSFKYKNTGTFNLVPAGEPPAGFYGLSTSGIVVENGYRLIRFGYRVTQKMVDEGIQLVFQADSSTTLHIAEVYCGFGPTSPHNFIPNQTTKYDLTKNGNIIFYSDVIPSSTDPFLSKPYISNDIALKNNPMPGDNVGWIYNGTTWLPYGIVGGKKITAVTNIATADATDATTVITLANANKAKINELLAAMRTSGLLA